jgi:transcription elongation factor Elf1
MNCPHCDHPHSVVIETRQKSDGDKRTRICKDCSKRFVTIERVAVYAGRALGYIEAAYQDEDEAVDAESEPAAEPEPEPVQPVPPRKPVPFVASLDDPELVTLPAETQSLLIEWWNNSRRSKHGASAAWTETAWQLSVRRLSRLSAAKQRQLVEAGVEHGWMALKPEYLKAAPAEPAGLAPRASSMQEAIDQWHATA